MARPKFTATAACVPSGFGLNRAPAVRGGALFARHAEGEGGTGGNPAPPERPEGISEDEWSALGDPGKTAIVRERTARREAERERDEARRPRPTPPPASKQQEAPAGAPQPPQDGDVAALVARAVQDALKPFQEREDAREVEQAAGRVRDAVATAARDRFHDPSDAVTGLDLAAVLDGNGAADPAKVTAALDDLLQRKPHLGKATDTRRRAADGALIGGGPAPGATLEDRVKAQLALMQRGT